MKSKITIRSNRDDGPHIRVEREHSDDVRDDLVQEFIEGFGNVSVYARVIYEPSQEDGKLTLKIIPIPPNEFTDTIKTLQMFQTINI